MKFKKGDVLVCVDPDSTNLLSKDKTYTVEYIKEGFLYFEELGIDSNGWLEWRFEISKESQFDKLYLRLKG